MKTLILHHDDCLRHDPGPRHPERPERVGAVLETVGSLPGTERLPAPRATPEQIARVHPSEYWEYVTGLEPGDDPSSPRVALDADTFLSAGSIDAALRGAGAACFALDQIAKGIASFGMVILVGDFNHET